MLPEISATTSDNENLRLCYRAGVADYSLPIKTFDIYLEEPVNMTEVTVSNVLTDTSYTDGSGNKINFKIYLPEGYKNSASCKLLFNFSSKTDIIDALIADKTDAVIVSFSGSTRECEKLVDAVVEAYDLNPYFMYMIGSAELASSIGCCTPWGQARPRREGYGIFRHSQDQSRLRICRESFFRSSRERNRQYVLRACQAELPCVHCPRPSR